MCCVIAVFVNVFDDWSVSATETLSEIGHHSYFLKKALLITEQFCSQYMLF